MRDLHLEIVTPDQIVFDQPVGLVEVPGTKGRFTILRQHAPIISALSKGIIRVVAKTGNEYLFDSEGGCLECEHNKITILVSKIHSIKAQ